MTTEEMDIIRMKGALNAVAGAIKSQLEEARKAAVNATDFDIFEKQRSLALDAWSEATGIFLQWKADKEMLHKLKNEKS